MLNAPSQKLPSADISVHKAPVRSCEAHFPFKTEIAEIYLG